MSGPTKFGILSDKNGADVVETYSNQEDANHRLSEIKRELDVNPDSYDVVPVEWDEEEFVFIHAETGEYVGEDMTD